MKDRHRQRAGTGRPGALVGALGVAIMLFASPESALAAERFVLLRLEEQGQVTELNPATNVSYRDLDTYLRSRLDGKKVLEVKVQETREACRQLILIRYSE